MFTPDEYWLLNKRTKDGRIVSIVSIDYHYETCVKPKGISANEWIHNCRLWTEKYPNWARECLVYVLLDEPQMSMTLDEFKKLYGYIKDEFIEQAYSQMIKKEAVLAIPVQAIILETPNDRDRDNGEDEEEGVGEGGEDAKTEELDN